MSTFMNKMTPVAGADEGRILRQLLRLVNFLTLPVIVIVGWEAVVRSQLVSPALLPSLERVIGTFWELIRSGQLGSDLLTSLGRLVKGYSLAVILGILFGVFMGISVRMNRFFVLVFDAVRQIPPLAWIPLIILWFGIGEISKVVIIFKAAFFPILLNTIGGIQQTPRSYLEVARLYEIRNFNLLCKVYLPAALPSILVGVRLGLSAAWMTMVAAELIAASSGLGYLINDGRELSQPDLVMVGMITIGMIGMVMDVLLRILGKSLLRGRK